MRDDDTPIRAGVFETVADAEAVVKDLLDAGFTTEDVSVLCSEETKLDHFHAFEHEKPAGTYTLSAATTGASIGALLGGTMLLVGTAGAAGVGLFAMGGIAIWTGAVTGGLIGAMLTRGVEHELADFYEQAVVSGRILVAVHSSDRIRLGRAESIFAAHGASSVHLPEG